MSDHVNYYDVLGIPHGSDVDEVEKGFRILAKKWHPDRNKNNKEEAEKKYKEITEAYSILTDEKKKQIYDSYGIEGLRGGVGEAGEAEQVFQMMSQMGGLGGLGGMIGNMMGMMGRSHESDENCGVPNIQTPLRISLEEAYTGKNIKAKVKRIDVCSKCEGSGTKDKNQDLVCTACNGNSPMTARMGMSCGTCKNTGTNPNIEKCKKCNGRKGIETEVEVNVKIPAGVFNKFRIILEGEGHQIPPDRIHPGTSSKDRTDLEFIIITPSESADSKFNRGVELIENIVDPADIFTKIEISFVDSVCGFVYDLEHIDNHMVKIAVPNSCRHLDTFVISGEGMPRLGKNKIVIKKGETYNTKTIESGNLVVQVYVQHPNEMELDSESKSKLVKLLGGKPYKAPKGAPVAITLDQYKKDYEIKYNSERMKEKYSKKSKKMENGNNDSDDSDNDSDDSGNFDNFRSFGGVPPGARVQVQECNPS